MFWTHCQFCPTFVVFCNVLFASQWKMVWHPPQRLPVQLKQEANNLFLPLSSFPPLSQPFPSCLSQGLILLLSEKSSLFRGWNVPNQFLDINDTHIYIYNFSVISISIWNFFFFEMILNENICTGWSSWETSVTTSSLGVLLPTDRGGSPTWQCLRPGH